MASLGWLLKVTLTNMTTFGSHSHYLHFSPYVYMHACICLRVYEHAHRRIWQLGRYQAWVSFLRSYLFCLPCCPHSLFWNRVFHWCPPFTNEAGCLAREPQPSPCFCLPSTGDTSLCHQTLASGCWRTQEDRHAWVASTRAIALAPPYMQPVY
jgi:hypothetical protein